MAKKKTAEERRRRAAEMKAQRLRLERRRKLLTIAGVTTAAVLVLGLLALAIFMEIRSRIIPGVREFEIGAAGHVEPERVDYAQSPPAGGEHWSTWQNCGVYPESVFPEFAVHSMEHGAVWITYEPELPEDEVQALTDMYSPGDYLVISPYEGEMDGPVVASAWGRQISAETADDEAFQRFVNLYERGTDVPEPGAACSGAASETEAEVEAILAEGGEAISEGSESMDSEEADAEGDEE